MENNILLANLGAQSKKLLEGCRVKADCGISLFTPDGVASYNALWLRDFAYMTEYAGEYLADREIEDCIRFSIDHRRSDGWMPDRVYADGTAVYAAGEADSPVGKANLDNAPFLVFTVYFYLNRLNTADARPLYRQWEADLLRSLNAVPLDEHGLVYNDPVNPHSPYGFTDTVGKTGELLMESLLYWRSCVMMAEMNERYGCAPLHIFSSKADSIKKNIGRLYDPSRNIYLAATEDCRQIDIWGNAYLLYIGFPVTEKIRSGILAYLKNNHAAYCYMGQIRHLPKGEYWQRLLIDIPKEEYQNGAYWATAAGWVVWCLAQTDPALAARTLIQAVECFQTEGSFECVNENYRKLNSFVVSATNVYGAAKRLMECERNAAFIQELRNMEKHGSGDE